MPGLFNEYSGVYQDTAAHSPADGHASIAAEGSSQALALVASAVGMTIGFVSVDDSQSQAVVLELRGRRLVSSSTTRRDK